MRSALAADLRCALDPVEFARVVGLEPDPWQRDVLRGHDRQTILNCSRQAGKSTVAAVLALHRALYKPSALVLLVSPSLRQSSELFKKIGYYATKLPHALALKESNRLSMTLENRSRVVSLPGTEGTIRGFSAVDLLIEDEASRVPNSLYFAIRPMLAISGGSIVLMSTPAGKVGHFYDEWENGSADWKRVKITADQCPRIDPEFLANERLSMGDAWYNQEFQGEFLQTSGQIIPEAAIMAALTDGIVQDDLSDITW